MARDENYSPEQHDSVSGNITYEWWCSRCGATHKSPYYECLGNYTAEATIKWWCQKCLDYHYGLYDCPYEDYDFCPHCKQLIKRANEGG